MPRLRGALERVEGDCRYELRFDSGELGVPYLEIRAQAELPLLCQRSLQCFGLPVRIEQRLGLVSREEQEAGLPEGYEMLMPEADGTIHPLDLIEDELILAIPVAPVDPRSEPVERSWPARDDADDGEARSNPFAALAGLKTK